MALNTSREAIVANRRVLVARARLRGATQREICQALASAGNMDPKTGKPWSLATINGDCQALSEEWRAECLKDTSEHKATVLAEIREARRKGWSDNDLDVVLKGLAQERALMGLDAPTQTVSKHEGLPSGETDPAKVATIIIAAEEALENARRKREEAAG